MATEKQLKKMALMPRFRRDAVHSQEEEDVGPPITKRASGGRRVSSDDFQETYLETKLKKEDGLASQAQTRAAIDKIEFDEKVGKLVTTNKAQEMLEKEHLAWIAEIEGLAQDISRRLFKRGIPIDTQEVLKTVVESACHDLRNRMSRVG